MNDHDTRIETGEPSNAGAKKPFWARNPPGILGALLLAAIGFIFLVDAGDLDVGTAGMMGPGYFPIALAIILFGLSAAILFQALRTSGKLPDIPLRPLLAVSAGILSFALLIEPFGLIPALIATVCLSSLADRQTKLPAVLALGVGVAVGAWLIFSLGLGLSMPAFRWAL